MEFAKGMNVKTKNFDDWEIIKLGINYEALGENPINDRGYINLDLKRSKEKGEWYAVIDDYKKE